MTREEEINEESINALEYYDHHPEYGILPTCAFRMGARWADETMLDRVCEWLHAELYDHRGGVEVKSYCTVEELTEALRRSILKNT